MRKIIKDVIIKEAFEKYYLSEDQLDSFIDLLDNDRVFLTGEAGTGKSYLLNTYIKLMRKNGYGVMVTAPTGIAAINIGGVTLHRTFRLGTEVFPKYYVRTKKEMSKELERVLSLLEATDILIIDEISMCRIDLFEAVMAIIIEYEKYAERTIKVVLCGDFLQLPPVLTDKQRDNFLKVRDNDDIYPFESRLWNEMKFIISSLVAVQRQEDPTLMANLTLARIGDEACIRYFNTFVGKDIKEEDAINIVSTNSRARAINNTYNYRLKGPKDDYSMYIKGRVENSDIVADRKVSLKVGSRVISVVNGPLDEDTGALRYSNGSVGTVVKLGDLGVEVEWGDGGTDFITVNTWNVFEYIAVETGKKRRKYELKERKIGEYSQIPLKLAFAITIHRSQGKTYDNVIIDPYSWETGQLYVALSRCKSPEGITLVKEIKPEYLIADDKVVSFLEKILKKEKNNLVKEEYKDMVEEMVSKRKAEEEIRKKIEEKELQERVKKESLSFLDVDKDIFKDIMSYLHLYYIEHQDKLNALDWYIHTNLVNYIASNGKIRLLQGLGQRARVIRIIIENNYDMDVLLNKCKEDAGIK